MVIVRLLAAGVGLALDAYAERSEARKRADTEYHGTGYGTLVKFEQDITNFNAIRNRNNLLGLKSEETRRRRIQRATELR
jgi:hypothetical protein